MSLLCFSFNYFAGGTDLKQELAVRQLEQKKHPEEDANKENKQPDVVSTPTKPEFSVPTTESQTNISTSSIGTSPLHTAYGTSPLTPSARISALNIVGDLLRKVGVGSLFYWYHNIENLVVQWSSG